MRNLKRALSLALASVMLLGMMAVSTGAAGFKDVDPAKHNTEAIEVLKMVGAMKGDDKGSFNPDQVVSRNEMAAVVSKMLGFESGVKGAAMPFNDVADWAKPFVAAIYAKGITAGTGANTFGGAEKLTVAQCAMWMLKALGYFQNPGDIPSNTTWDLAVATKADEIGLLKGVKAGLNDGMTRNEVAQLVLNALKSDVVTFAGVPGTQITTSDGTKITQGYQSKYVAKELKNESSNYDKTPDHAGLGTLQLAEKLYDRKLELVESSGDDYGRPAHQWNYDREKVVAADTADLVYTKAVKAKDVARDLNIKEKDLDLKTNKQTLDKSGNGIVTEIFMKADGKTVEQVVTIESFLTTVSRVEKANDKHDRQIVLALKNKVFVTEGFEADDEVLVTLKNNEAEDVATVMPAGKMTGKLTKLTGDYLYIDGTKYTRAAGYTNGATAPEVGKDVDFYLVNGYVLKAGLASTEVKANLDNLALVVDAQARNNSDKYFGSKKDNMVALLKADGTEIVVKADKDYSKTGENLVGHVVTFSEKKGEYSLTNKSGSRTMEGGSFSGYTADVPTMNKTALDGETVFVYRVFKDGKDTSGKLKVYKGFKNAPEIKGDANMAAYVPKDEAAALVFVQVREDKLVKAESKETIFVAGNNDKLVNEYINDKSVEYYEVWAVINGKAELIKVDPKLNLKLGTQVVYESFTKDEYGVYTLDSANKDVKQVGKSVQVEKGKGVVKLAGSTYAYADGARVYTVDKDGKVTVDAIEKLTKGEYQVSYMAVDKDHDKVIKTLILAPQIKD